MAAKKNAELDLRFIGDMTESELNAWIRRKNLYAAQKEDSIIIVDKDGKHLATFNKLKNRLHSSIPIW